MIKVKILRNKNGNIYEVDVNGHAEYDELGKDIVCAAVSGIVQTAVFGLIRVLGLQVDLTIEEGFLRFCIPNELLANGDNEGLRSKVNIILDTMVIGLEEIEKSYSDYIEVLNIEGGV
ncbi:MAG TPA: ribosomal-processing cysteine protease Prp [Thermoanaerobacterales bacterium]|nr:ribosomal-processing cysteine protease Prp [Thermoanaerobacterales bacterium]